MSAPADKTGPLPRIVFPVAGARKPKLTLKQRKARNRKMALKAVDMVFLTSRGGLSAFWRAKTILGIKLGLYPEFGTEMLAREVLHLAGNLNDIVTTLNDSSRYLEQIAESVRLNNANDEATDKKFAALNIRLKLLEDMAAKVGGEDEGSYVQ